MVQKPRLYVLPPSHFCERARWALDYAGLAYEEVPWAVGAHVLLARRLATGTTLPIFDTGEEIIQGSDRILDRAGLSGHDAPLEHRFESRIGPLVRQYIYAASLNNPQSDVRSSLFRGISGVQSIVGRAVWPVTRRLMIGGMNARATLLPTLERDLDAELEWFAGQALYRCYLVGERFGRAYITAASLLAPLARPETGPPYRDIKLPAEIEATLCRWGEGPALQWVCRIYRERRHANPS